MRYDILVIDDEADIRDLICDALKDESYETRKASDSITAFNLINEKLPTVIILDIWLQGSELDGLGILEIIKKKYPSVPVIMVSGHGTIETAVNSIKIGAYDYIEKPFTEDKLLVTVKRACEFTKLIKENADLKLRIKDKLELIGNSSIILQLKATIEKVAPTSSRILISGPAGSGKELVARLIHQKSKRGGSFVVLNTTGLSPENIDTELFGQDIKLGINEPPRKFGILELANYGTLFIDEVADLPIYAQTKLLKFLQDQTFERTTNKQKIKLDVRVIAATTKDLQEKIKLAKFNKDLYYRLNLINIKTPSLSERREDIALLCKYFLKYLQDYSGLIPKKFSEDAIMSLQSYNWPCNVRQLRNVIEWVLIMNQDSKISEIKSSMLPPAIFSNNTILDESEDSEDVMSLPLREAREIFERRYLSAQMMRFSGNISKTSIFVRMERSALHRKLKSLNINTSNVFNEELEEA